jgi:hypothetical protein
MSYRQWAAKLAAVAPIYVILYFAFGYIVAWQNPEVRATYDNGSNPDVFNRREKRPPGEITVTTH